MGGGRKSAHQLISRGTVNQAHLITNLDVEIKANWNVVSGSAPYGLCEKISEDE